MKENKDYKEFLLEIVKDYGQTLSFILKNFKQNLSIADAKNLKEKLSHLAVIVAIESEAKPAEEVKKDLTVN